MHFVRFCVTKYVLFLCLSVSLFKHICAQDRGVIFIGNSTDDLATEYTYSFTAINTPQSIPVFATVFSNGDPSATVAKAEDIRISCSVLSSDPGLTTVSIADTNLAAAQTSGSVTLTPQAHGRTTSVQCAGQTTSGTCPISAGGAQFCLETSQSNIVAVTVGPPATVSQCKLELYVMDGSSTFDVRLSEPALTQVNVVCTAEAGSTLGLTITDLNLPAGSTTGEVSFLVPGGSEGSSARVTCTASSVSGSQYTTTSSQVDASTAVFRWRANSLSFAPADVKVFNTTVTSFLVLASPLNARSVSVACRAYTEASLQAALQTAASAPDCSQVDSSTSEETVPWRVRTAFYDLVSDTATADDLGYFKAVTTERVQPITAAVSEVVLTRCCVRNVAANAQFLGLHATMITVAELAPFVCQQCNTTVENAREERVLQNPGYVEVAPCACDLTSDACDFNCCCDEECSANQKLRFSSCIPGLPGGEGADPEEYRCSSSAFNLPDWHLMTCVIYESNAYLGQYYLNRARVPEMDFTETVSAEYKGRYSFSKPEPIFQTQPTAYSHGVSLVTIREDVTAGPGSRGILALPRPGADDACQTSSPVRFLVDETASCTSTLLPDSCAALSRFSGRVYLVSSAISGCSQSFKVSSTLSGASVAPADVRYYCASDLSPYLPANSTALDALSQTRASTFGTFLANENCTTPCSSQTCIDYNIGRGADSRPALPSPCSWDDGTTSPLVPGLDNSNTCENVVLDVRYRFEWSGSQIASLSADIVLGDVPNVLIGSGVTLTQMFSTEWVHRSNGSTYTLSDNFDSTAEAYSRSGSAGYDDGASLLSGCPVYNQTTQQFLQVQTNAERQMAVWRPGVDGLCENAARQGLTFADAMYSACALRLTVEDLGSGCEDLRQTIFNHLNVLMPSDVLGRYGYNNVEDLSMWIPVIRQTLNATEDTSVLVPTNVSGSGPEAFRTWADSITGQCLVPNSINLNIMYAQTGAVNGYPRQEVVGAYISYTQTLWSMDCQGAQAVRCVAGSGVTQNFFLSSSVQYTKVDTSLQSSETRFHTKCDPYNFAGSSSCERFFSNVYREECYWETCWQELAYPVEPSADRGPEYDWRLQALPAFLALVLGIVGYASVARPGWS